MGQGQIIGAVFVCFGLACAVISTLLDFWCYVYNKNGLSQDFGYALYFGLWNYCKRYHKNGMVVTDCTSWLEYRNDKEVSMDWLKGCQALMIFGTWLYGSAFLAAVTCIKTSQQTRPCAYMSGMGAVCCAAATILFAANMYHIINAGAQGILHAGFGLAASSVVFGLVAIYFLWRHTPAAGYQNIDVF